VGRKPVQRCVEFISPSGAAMTLPHTNEELDQIVLEHDARLGRRVVDELVAFLKRFVSYPTQNALVAHALWILHTHLMHCWDSTPRLAFLSAEPASGKTRAMEVTELLVPNPIPTVNVTPAYLIRKIGYGDGATILFDEVDTIFGAKAKEHEDIRGLLNAGHRRGATTGRCLVRGKEVITEEIPAYAAVAVAGLGWLPDTLMSRSIIIRMRRRKNTEQVEPFRRRLHEREGWALRDEIALWARCVGASMKWPELPAQISDRNADVWEPLIAVADLLDEQWSGYARATAIALIEQAIDVEPSLGIRLLGDIRIIFGNANEMSSKTLLAGLHQIEEAPWADIRGKPLDERGLAARLRQYGVRSKTIRVDGETPKGYTRADLADVWSRYLPQSGAKPATSATSATEGSTVVAAGSYESMACATQVSCDVADVADVARWQDSERVCAHCQAGGESFCEASVAGKTIWLHLRCKDAYRP
jgi:hypothetical protein